ncbi:MAG TPA: hypothetical protein VGP47_08780 [Parachlamydiaceae bacterium]|nr:hypothetical protein [Parachlamydiaceae bacterium]
MKKNVFIKSMMGFVFGAGALFAPCAMTALVTVDATDECAKELLLSYFPEPIVKETLKRFSVADDKVSGITRSLSNKDKEVVKIVEDKAKAMNPNPLKDPQQRPAAVKLFRETLLQVFTEALQENGITDTSKFQAMLDDIQQQKAKKFAMCMDKQKTVTPSKDDDNDDNDDDDDNDDNDDDDSDDDQNDQDDNSNSDKLRIDVKKTN